MTYPDLIQSRARLARACLESAQAGIVAVEAERQRKLIEQALIVLAQGKQTEARTILAQLNPTQERVRN